MLRLIVIPMRILPCQSITITRINICIVDYAGPSGSKAPLVNKVRKDNDAASLFTLVEWDVKLHCSRAICVREKLSGVRGEYTPEEEGETKSIMETPGKN